VTVRPTPLVIAIDGPSGSGKSSVSRAVAQHLVLAYLDTGAMYRALTWWCLHEGVELEDQPAVARAAKDLPLQMGTDPSSPWVKVDGVGIDDAIRTTEISASVSKVATNLGVRDRAVPSPARPDSRVGRNQWGSGGRGPRHHDRGCAGR